MVQFNLLPDVKLEYVKAQRTKYLMTFISVVVSIVALTVFFVSLFVVNVVQKKTLSDLNSDVTSYSKKLKDTNDLSKILTVQNQLSTLTALHDGKPVTSRLFDYISQVTPSQANLNKLTLDYKQNTLSIGGTAPSLDAVSLYTDTLKSTYYSVDKSSTKVKAFSDVVLASFARDSKGATFTITLSFDPTIFNAINTIKLIVPNTASAGQANVFDAGGN